MRTQTNIITEVLVRNNRTTTDSFITDTMLKDWYTASYKWAASFKPWPFTEGRVSTTYASTEEWSFEGYKADSFRFLQVGGYRLQKLNFEDYQIFREERSGDNDRVYSDFGKLVYINPNLDVSGTLTAYGQYQPAIDTTDEAGTTVFTDYNEEGNEAIVEKMSGYLKRREHLPQEAELHDQRSVAKLEEIWKRIQDEQFAYQTKDRGMWERIDILDGQQYDDKISTDQF